MKLDFKKDNILQKKNWIIMGLVALLLVVGAAGFVAAKYISNYQQEAEIHASDFHFSSNYLKYIANDSVVPEYTVSDWGDHAVTFQLYNYEAENVALISDSEITYKIEVGSDWTVSVKDATGKEVTADNGIYTMDASTAAMSHSVTLTYEDDEPATVEVSVKSTAPYSKELKARFNLSTKKGVEYTVEDKGDYDVVTIKTNNYYGPITVEWTENHAPDNTCDYMGTWINVNKGIIDATEYKTYELIFFENTADDYNEKTSGISVSEGGGN